ncbi:MAG: hypothetical protein AB7U75_14650 [Hyphomicrobiaceae bacterium]
MDWEFNDGREDFERDIALAFQMGALDRQMAIAWAVAANGCADCEDAEEVCYELGLPYSMAGEIAPALEG